MSTSLTDDLTRLPAQPVAAMRLLRLVDDPQASAADLARIVEADPALSARVIRLANAPYCGLSSKVSSAGHAVVLLGFASVRALAVSAACGLLSEQTEQTEQGPEGFWTHSVATAVASAVVGRRVGVSSGDAFSAGLLHDLGSALLYRHAPERYEAAMEMADRGLPHLEAERAEFGSDHAEAGAVVLEAWRFPALFVRAIASHHAPPEEVVGRLGRVVVAGEALAMLVEPPPHHPPVADAEAALAALRVGGDAVPGLLEEITRDIGALGRFLGVGAP